MYKTRIGTNTYSIPRSFSKWRRLYSTGPDTAQPPTTAEYASQKYMQLAQSLEAQQKTQQKNDRQRFLDIASKIDQRRTEFDLATHTPPETIQKYKLQPKLSYDLSFFDFTSAYQVGDLVESQRAGLSVVVQEPQNTDNKVTICNASGTILKVGRRDLVFRLGPFVNPKLLHDCVREIPTNNNARVDLVITPNVRGQICRPMREFYRQVYSMTSKIRPALDDVWRAKSRSNIPENMSFFELASRIQSRIRAGSSSEIDKQQDREEEETKENVQTDTDGSEFPPSFPHKVDAIVLYSVYKLVENVYYRQLITSSGPSLDNIVIQPSENADPALVRFALGDYNKNDTELQSSAIGKLRKTVKYKAEVISTETAMHKVQNMLVPGHGPRYNKQELAFLKQNYSHNTVTKDDITADSAAQIRTDAGALPVYCIDASDAHEIDDGISIQEQGAAVKIGIHIADPVSSLHDSSTLRSLQNAYKTTSTVYFPAGIIRMLEKSFSDQFSLVPGQPRRCMSFYFKYDKESGNLHKNSIKIKPETLTNVVQLTYDHVDQILNNPKAEHYANLSSLNTVAQLLRQERESNGAINLNLPQSSVIVDDQVNVTVKTESYSASRKLVEEMMVMANHLVAVFTDENSIPSVYRSQSVHFTSAKDQLFKPTDKSHNNTMSIGDSFRMLRKMNSANLSTFPASHQSLGVSKYSHTTSPLRRFQDLLVHWQLHSYLTGKPLIPEVQLGAMAVQIQTKQALISRAQQNSKTYWILRKILMDSIQQRNGHQQRLQFECVVSRDTNSDGVGYVFCTSYGVEAVVERMPNHEAIQVGATVICSLDSVDPEVLSLKLIFDTMKL